MASGSSGRAANSGSKTYDFASDDILCSYNDFNDSNHDSENISHSDPPATNGSSSLKEYHNNRKTRMFPGNSYSQPEEYPSQDMITVVEGTMKKYTDNLMRFLEGISSRLSQLELYCYNLDKSIGEMRSDLVHDHGEADSKLKSLEKHLQEVHRSVQILRDKQELSDTQKELAKLQCAQKDSFTGANSQHSEERVATPVSDSKNSEHNTSDVQNQQLAIVPHQVAAPQSSLPTRPIEQPQPVTPLLQAPPQNVIQSQSYYLPTNQLPNPPPQQIQTPHDQYMQSQLTQTVHPCPQYQQQWPQHLSQQPQQLSQQPQQLSQQPQQLPQQQQLHQQPQPQQQPSMQTQVRPQSSPVYSQYPQSQPTNTSSEEVPFPGIPQPMLSRGDTMPYGYIPGRTVQQQPPLPQHVKPNFGPQSGDGYTPNMHHPALSSASSYVIYNSDGMRAHQPPPQQQPLYTPGGYPPQRNTSTNPVIRNPSQSQFMRNHPYYELMEKLASMGYMSDHVSSVIQRLEESGQAVDFNAVLDRLNSHSSGGSQQGWSR